MLGGGAAAALLLLAHGRVPSSDSRHTARGVLERRLVPVGIRLGGTVRQILVSEGATVKKGQVLVQMDDAELRAKYASMQSAMQSSQASARALASVRGLLIRIHPDIQTADRDYVAALEQFDSSAPPDRRAAQARLDAAARNRVNVRSRISQQLQGPSASLLREARETLSRMDALLGETAIRAPADGIIEIMQIKAADVLPPFSSVAALATGEAWVEIQTAEALVPGALLKARLDGSAQVLDCRVESARRNRSAQAFTVRVLLPKGLPGTSATFSLP